MATVLLSATKDNGSVPTTPACAFILFVKMGVHDKDVIAKIGKKAWDILLEEVSKGTIDHQIMTDFARQLGSKVGGNHSRRGNCDEAEMREVLTVRMYKYKHCVKNFQWNN